MKGGIIWQKGDGNMDKEKAMWWVNLLFNIHQLDFMKNDNMEKAKEVEAAREFIINELQKEGDK